MKALAKLIRFQKKQIDEQRFVVNQVADRIMRLEEELVHLHKSLDYEQELASDTIEASLMFPIYAKGVNTKKNRIKRYLQEVKMQLMQEQEKLHLQFEELKRYEIIYDAYLKKEKVQQEKKIQDSQDDITISRHYLK